MKHKKLITVTSLLSVAAAITVSAFILYGNARSNKNRSLDIKVEKTSHQEVLDKFNKEHGTNYKIATDAQEQAVGITPEQRDSFISGMNDKEFEEYLSSLYSNDEQVISNMPFYENDEKPEKVINKAKIVDDINEIGELVNDYENKTI